MVITPPLPSIRSMVRVSLSAYPLVVSRTNIKKTAVINNRSPSLLSFAYHAPHQRFNRVIMFYDNHRSIRSLCDGLRNTAEENLWVCSARGKIALFLWQISGIICGNHLSEKPAIYPLARKLYCAWPETAFLAKCEDGACQGTVAEKSVILTGVECI